MISMTLEMLADFQQWIVAVGYRQPHMSEIQESDLSTVFMHECKEDLRERGKGVLEKE